MRLGSLKAVFEKIDRYQERRSSLAEPRFVSETTYTLTEEQLAEIDGKGLSIEQFFMSRLGRREASVFNELKTRGEPFSIEEIEDLAEDLVKTIWDCKDRIKKLADANGISKDQFWTEIKKHRELCVIADLANTIKHDGLNKLSLSGIKPIINGVRNYAKGNGNAVYKRNGDKIIVSYPLSDFEIFASIRDLDNQTDEVGEVFDFCDLAVKQWGKILENLKISLPSTHYKSIVS